MSAITSASGSTVLLSSATEASGAFGAAAPSLRIAASASASGSSIGSSVGLSEALVAAGALVAPGAGSAGPTNVGGAYLTPTSFAQSFAMSPIPDSTIITR